jgi:hypothetical protein
VSKTQTAYTIGAVKCRGRREEGEERVERASERVTQTRPHTEAGQEREERAERKTGIRMHREQLPQAREVSG